MNNPRFLTWALAALALPLAACGLVDPDITDFDLALPDKQFTIDAQRWNLQATAPLIDASCSPSNDPCASGAQQACDMGQCAAACDTSTSTCDLTLYVSLFKEVDLVTEKPELQKIQEQPVLDVTIDAIKYEVLANSLNTDTPTLILYAAPSTVMRPDDRARRIGTIPPIAAGATHPPTDIVFDADGKDNLAMFMADYKTPFNILVGSELLIEQGDSIPQGATTVRVSVEAHAGI